MNRTPRKIKVVRIIARLNIGGPAIHVILLTKGLNPHRFESKLICGEVEKDEGDMGYYALAQGVHILSVPALRRAINCFSDLCAFQRIYSILKEEKPDIVHTHTAKAGTLGRLAALALKLRFRRKGPAIIHTFHGHVLSGYFNPFATGIFIFTERLLGLFTDRIVTVSESVRKELIRLRIADPRRIVVVPLGLELEQFLRVPPPEKRDTLHVGIVGRLVPIKNHALFLEAAAEVIRANPARRVKFKIIGDGELKEKLMAHAQRLSIGAHVDFLGWQRDLPCVYRDLDVVALTSCNEGTPVSLIEAMASARPVVATEVGGVADLLAPTGARRVSGGVTLSERGVLVPSGDSARFASALSFLLKDSRAREAMGEKARDFVALRFGKDRLLADMEKLYDECICDILTP